jgi:hypothetical protein
MFLALVARKVMGYNSEIGKKHGVEMYTWKTIPSYDTLSALLGH